MKSLLTSMSPRWSQMTQVQKNAVSNGCGRKGGWLNPPSFIFRASCDQHDFYYWRGATSADRKVADVAFLHAMLDDTRRSRWYLRWFHRSMAWTYYGAVRAFGKKSFTYRFFPATWMDLNDLL